MITYANIGTAGDRMTIHDVDQASLRTVYLTNFELGMPVVREDMDDRSRSHGTDDFTAFYGVRAINMTGVIFSHDLAAQSVILDNLKAHFSLFGSAQKELTFQRLGRSYKEFVYGRVADFNAPIDTPGNMVEWSATFVCSDPRIYQRGTPDPHTVSFKSAHVFKNKGTGINTPPVIRIYGPAEVGCGVKNSSLDVERTFELAREIKRGSHVEVNMKTRIATLNGERAQNVLKPGAWFWHLKPGDNHVQRFGKLDGHIEVDWREARL